MLHSLVRAQSAPVPWGFPSTMSQNNTPVHRMNVQIKGSHPVFLEPKARCLLEGVGRGLRFALRRIRGQSARLSSVPFLGCPSGQPAPCVGGSPSTSRSQRGSRVSRLPAGKNVALGGPSGFQPTGGAVGGCEGTWGLREDRVSPGSQEKLVLCPSLQGGGRLSLCASPHHGKVDWGARRLGERGESLRLSEPPRPALES